MILGPACVLAVLTFFSGLPFFVKVGVAVGLVGLAAAYAMVRLEGRYTIEAYLLHQLGYAQRVHRRSTRGSGGRLRQPRSRAQRNLCSANLGVRPHAEPGSLSRPEKSRLTRRWLLMRWVWLCCRCSWPGWGQGASTSS